MSKSPNRLRRAGLAGLATAAMVVSLSGYGVTAASADSGFSFDRVVDSAHMNRFGTSVAAAKLFGTSNSVILANGEKGHYPDALTASYLSQDKNAPVLLTKLATTPDVVTQYLKDTNVQNITIVGGPEAVSAGQLAALTDAGYTVNRIQGTGDDTTRYGTARAVSAAVGGTHDTAVLATGEAFPDAVAAGPLSYAEDFPLAITKTNTVPQATLDALKAANVKHVVVVGGQNAISDAVIAQLKANNIDVTYRADGATRSETSTKLANIEIDHYDFTDTRVNVASGKDALTGADALSAGPVSGEENRPTLITASNGNVGSLGDFLSAHSATLSGTDNHIFGGPDAVSQAVEDALEAAAQADNTAPNVTAATAADATGGDTVAVTYNEVVQGTGTYTVYADDTCTTAQVGLTPSPATSGQNTKTVTVKFANADFQGDANGPFYIQSTGEKDAAGNTTATSACKLIDQTGTTAPDTTGPMVTAATAADATGGDTVAVTYDEVVAGTGTYTVYDDMACNNAVAGLASTQPTSGQNSKTVTVKFANADFQGAANGPFYIQSTGEKDAAGNTTPTSGCQLINQTGTTATPAN